MQLLSSSHLAVQEERALLLHRLLASRSRGLACRSTSCSSCSRSLAQGGGRGVLCRCGHCFHATCLDREGGLGLSDLGEEVGLLTPALLLILLRYGCVSCANLEEPEVAKEGARRSRKSRGRHRRSWRPGTISSYWAEWTILVVFLKETPSSSLAPSS